MWVNNSRKKYMESILSDPQHFSSDEVRVLYRQHSCEGCQKTLHILKKNIDLCRESIWILTFIYKNMYI